MHGGYANLECNGKARLCLALKFLNGTDASKQTSKKTNTIFIVNFPIYMNTCVYDI